MERGIIGIAGGMGPEAGISLSGMIIRHTVAGCDQDHLPVVLFSIPEIMPDRTAFITGKITENPAGGILEVLSLMKRAGVTLAALACNSAHAPVIFDVVESGLHKMAPNGGRMTLII